MSELPDWTEWTSCDGRPCPVCDVTLPPAPRVPTVEEAQAIMTLVRGGWLKLELTVGDS